MNFRLGFLAALAGLGTVTAQEEPIFGYGDVVKKAEALAQQPFAPQLQQLSPDLQNLDYDLYRRIRFLPEHTVWPSLPYRLGFFHPGYYYKQQASLLLKGEAKNAVSRPFGATSRDFHASRCRSFHSLIAASQSL